MKKLILLLSLFLFGCGDPYPEESVPKENNAYFTTVNLYGCQYFEYKVGRIPYNWHVYNLTHRGDCNNPIHQCKCK